MTAAATPAPLDRSGLEALGVELAAGVRVTADSGPLTVMPTKEEMFEAEWKRVVAGLRQCQARLARHPKVMFFSVSRDEREVSVKVNDGTPRGGYIILSRNPSKPQPVPTEGVWLSDMGQPEKRWAAPADGMAEMIRRIAAHLG